MANTQAYRINIEVTDGYLTITPYKVELNYLGDSTVFTTSYERPSTRSNHIFKCRMNQANHDVISYVLDSEEWQNRTYWDGYSEWEYTTYLTVGETPDKIQKWLAKLPRYEIKLQSEEERNA